MDSQGPTNKSPTQLSLFDQRQPSRPDPEPTTPPTATEPAGSTPPSTISAQTSLNTATAAYIEHLQHRVQINDLAQSSFNAMRRDVEVAGRILGLHRPIGDLTRRDFHQGLVNALRQRYSDATVARRVATTNGFISWLADRGAADLPTIPSPKVDEDLPTVLHDGQVRELLQATSQGDPQPAFLVRLLLSTGCKKYEAMKLKVQDMHLDADPPYVTIRGKGRKQRTIHVPPQLQSYYEAYREQYGPMDTVFTVVARTLEKELAALSEALNAPISFSTLRWTAAYRDLKRGMDPERLRRKLALAPDTWEDTLDRLRRLGV
jgi:integrase